MTSKHRIPPPPEPSLAEAALRERLGQCPVVAILRGVRPEEAVDIATALFESGVRAVEVPLNSPQPLESIRRIAQVLGDRMSVGAGTVLWPVEVEEVAAAGGRMIVSPNTRPEVIERSISLGLSAAPGFATATEALVAHAAGARHLKLFPASTYGPGHLRQLLAVLPSDTMIWAVGGVRPSTLEAWWAAGARAFGVGSELYRPGQSPGETHRRAAPLVAGALGLARKL